MDFLNDVCDSSAILRLFYFIKLAFYALQIILPILCIYMSIKRCFAAVVSNDSRKKLVELTPQTVRMLAAAFAFFFVPLIVEFAINSMGEHDVDFAYCFVEATPDNIEALQAEEMRALEEESANRREELLEQTKEKQKEIEASYAAKTKRDEANNSNRNNNTQSGGGSSQTSNNSSQNTSQNASQNTSQNTSSLTDGDEGNYFAPLQNTHYYIGVKNSTGGCDNPVYHDAPVASGTPIYAGMDGTVTYYQYTCDTVLYGYGNLAVLTAEDGTFIRYSHLSRFGFGYQARYTATCPKKPNNEVPCPSNTCSKSLSVLKIGSRDVKKGQVIGYTGDTGNSTGPHLHVEIHEKGSSVCVTDPFKAFGMR